MRQRPGRPDKTVARTSFLWGATRCMAAGAQGSSGTQQQPAPAVVQPAPRAASTTAVAATMTAPGEEQPPPPSGASPPARGTHWRKRRRLPAPDWPAEMRPYWYVGAGAVGLGAHVGLQRRVKAAAPAHRQRQLRGHETSGVAAGIGRIFPGEEARRHGTIGHRHGQSVPDRQPPFAEVVEEVAQLQAEVEDAMRVVWECRSPLSKAPNPAVVTELSARSHALLLYPGADGLALEGAWAAEGEGQQPGGGSPIAASRRG